jgi:hypothetical protein
VTPQLERAAGSGPPREWWRRYPFSVATLAVGAIAALVGVWLQFHGRLAITDVPDPRVMAPLFGLALGLGVTSFVRREPQRLVAVCGVLLAGTAMVMGWFVVLSAVALVAVLIGKIVAELI